MKKSAVFILLGQSNAVGHAIPMKKEDIIYKPLKNVYGLSRTKNQTYENKELVFIGSDLPDKKGDYLYLTPEEGEKPLSFLRSAGYSPRHRSGWAYSV